MRVAAAYPRPRTVRATTRTGRATVEALWIDPLSATAARYRARAVAVMTEGATGYSAGRVTPPPLDPDGAAHDDEAKQGDRKERRAPGGRDHRSASPPSFHVSGRSSRHRGDPSVLRPDICWSRGGRNLLKCVALKVVRSYLYT